MKIAVLLTVHNRCAKTLKCLKTFVSLPGFTEEVFDFYVVDDGSNDGTSDELKKNFPTVNIISGNGDLFWNRGMLLAWETAKKSYDYDGYLWLNDDVILKKNAIELLFNYSQSLTNSILVGAMCSTYDENEITYSGYSHKRNYRIVPQEEPVRCECFNGNFVYVPRSVTNKIGLLNPYFRHSCGDYEYGYRANSKGIESYVIGVVGECDRNPGSPKWLNPNLSLFDRIRLLYSPTGNNPFEEYKVTRYEALADAVGIFVYLHVKALFPNFNLKKKNG